MPDCFSFVFGLWGWILTLPFYTSPSFQFPKPGSITYVSIVTVAISWRVVNKKPWFNDTRNRMASSQKGKGDLEHVTRF